MLTKCLGRKNLELRIAPKSIFAAVWLRLWPFVQV